MRVAAHSLSPLLDAYQQLAIRCAEQESMVADDLDAMMGKIEHLLASAEVETRDDLLAKGRFLATYRSDPAMIPAVALDTLVAGIERLCGAPTLAAAA